MLPLYNMLNTALTPDSNAGLKNYDAGQTNMATFQWNIWNAYTAMIFFRFFFVISKYDSILVFQNLYVDCQIIAIFFHTFFILNFYRLIETKVSICSNSHGNLKFLGWFHVIISALCFIYSKLRYNNFTIDCIKCTWITLFFCVYLPMNVERLYRNINWSQQTWIVSFKYDSWVAITKCRTEILCTKWRPSHAD